MNRLRLAIIIVGLLSALTVAAEDIHKQIEAARKDMYRLYGTDSVSRFLETTDRLKTLTKESGDNQLFYQPLLQAGWSIALVCPE